MCRKFVVFILSTIVSIILSPAIVSAEGIHIAELTSFKDDTAYSFINDFSVASLGEKLEFVHLMSAEGKTETPPLSSIPTIKVSMSSLEPITLTIGSPTVKRGEVIAQEPQVLPQIINGRTMLPLRYLIQDILGGEVEYDDEFRKMTVLILGLDMRLFIDAPFVEVGDRTFRMDQAPVIVANHTLVPLRAFEFVTEDILWDTDTKTITFTPSTPDAIAQRIENLTGLEPGLVYAQTLPNIDNAIVDVDNRQLIFNEIYSNDYRMKSWEGETPAEYAHRFLRTLISSDARAALFLSPSTRDAYNFIASTVFDGYEITATGSDGSALGVRVRLTVSESTNPIFPVGDSLWDLSVRGGEMCDIALFAPVDENRLGAVKFANPIDPDGHFNFCAQFSLAFGIYGNCDNFAATIEPYLNIGNHLHYLLHYYDRAKTDSRKYIIGMPSYEPGGMKGLEKFLNNVIDASEINYRGYYAKTAYGYNEELDSTKAEYLCAHGGSWLYWQPVSNTYDDTNKVYKTVLNYYSDAVYFLVARTVQYTYYVNEDGTFSMNSIEIIYDSGYPLMYGNI